MKCPFCYEEDTSVIDTRSTDEGRSIRRRRECPKCKKRFTTYEKYETMPLLIIKKDGTRQEFNKEKIEKGILASCNKCPIAAEDIQELINDVESRLYMLDKKEIPSTIVGEYVMEGLKKLNSVAYIRFASVYRDFKDVDSFVNEISNLRQDTKS